MTCANDGTAGCRVERDGCAQKQAHVPVRIEAVAAGREVAECMTDGDADAAALCVVADVPELAEERVGMSDDEDEVVI